MRKIFFITAVSLLTMVISSCSTLQGRYKIIGEKYPPKPNNYEVEIFRESLPERDFIRVSKLEVHSEKSQFCGNALENVLPELKKQARLSGADAIIEIKEKRSRVVEFNMFHVTATGIRYIAFDKAEAKGWEQ